MSKCDGRERRAHLDQTVVADHKYGMAENFVACHQQGVMTHPGDAKAKRGKVEGIFPEDPFRYQPPATPICIRRASGCGGGATCGGNGFGNMEPTQRLVPGAPCARNARAPNTRG